MALERGLRPWVLARQTKLKVDTTLKPGTIVKMDTSHIVPTELSDGLVVNLPEMLGYQFHLGFMTGMPSWWEADLADSHRLF